MSITREQQADLHRGDTLELKFNQDGAALTLRGTFPEITNFYDNYLGGPYTLTVVSRAPRPLYVNHPRTKPHVGDVIRDADDDQHPVVWLFSSGDFVAPWYCGTGYFEREHLPKRLRLLVDGETGRVVQ